MSTERTTKSANTKDKLNKIFNGKNIVKFLPAIFLTALTSQDQAPKFKFASDYKGNERIAFVSTNIEGEINIFTMNSDGRDITRLTDTNGLRDTSYPHWSPDGNQIAFSSWSPNNFDIYLMNSNGGSEVRLTSQLSDESLPTWSPNGQQIAFVSNKTGNYELYVMNSDGTGQTKLTNLLSRVESPQWNPKTNEIVFHVWIGNPYNIDLYKIDSNGNNLTRITQDEAEDLNASWSPDGNEIAFSSNRDGNFEIYISNSDGSNIRRITNTSSTQEFRNDWSPDGKFLIAEFTNNIGTSLLSINLETLEEKIILDLNTHDNNQFPAWSKFPIKNSFGFLNLPFSDSEHFNIYTQGNINGTGPGRVNSWFDHQYPTYNLAPNNLFPGILRWDGRFFQEPTKMGEGWYNGHNGIDFQPTSVGEQAFPAATGTVFGVVNNCILGDKDCGSGFGNQVWINHENGYATLYGHLKNVYVNNGQIVDNLNIPLGTIGSTGNSTGAHLHFGTYFDQNQNGIWVPNEAVDPYGWQGSGTDPWNTNSQYLWADNLWQSETIDTLGGTIKSPSGKTIINFPPNIFSVPTLFEIWEKTGLLGATNLARSIGSGFSLNQVNPDNQNLQVVTGSQQATVVVNYNDSQLKHLNENEIKINKLSTDGNTWIEIPTTVNTISNTASAEIDVLDGNFDLQAPLICATDTLEPNDTYNAAQSLQINIEKTGILDIAQDEDWFQIVLEQGQNYEVIASPLTLGGRTLIEIYDLDAVTPIAGIEGGGPITSSITIPATKTGEYFIKISNAQGGSTGCSSQYSLKVRPAIFGPNPSNKIFLPMAIK